MADPDLTRRLRDWPYGKPMATKADCLAAADRIDQLERQLAALHTAISDPANKGVLDCWSPITYDAYGDGTPVERECGDCAPCRVAAAVEHTKEGT